MTPTIQSRSSSAGFTMTELLVSVAISLMLSTSGWLFFRGQLRALTNQSASLDAIEGARAAVDLMANDIRMAGADPSGAWIPAAAAGSCAKGLSGAQTKNLTVSWDGANGGAINGTIEAGESITYAYDSANKRINRTVNGTTQTLISNVPTGGLVFQYFTNTTQVTLGGSPSNPQVGTGDCDNVNIVKVSVLVQTARGVTVTNVNLASQVTLRNRALARIGTAS